MPVSSTPTSTRRSPALTAWAWSALIIVMPHSLLSSGSMPSVGPGLAAAVEVRALPRFSRSTFFALATAAPVAWVSGKRPMLRSRVAPRSASWVRAARANPVTREVT